MSAHPWRALLFLGALAGLTACGPAVPGSGNEVQVTLQARFEKRPLGPAGLGATQVLPVRYCYAEVREAGTGEVLASGFLGSDGSGTAQVPQGAQVYLQVYARYQVPCADPASFFMQGHVKQASLFVGPYVSRSQYEAYPDWSVTSDTVTVLQEGTLTVTAQADNRRAGAFNIADQAIRFATSIRDMEGTGTLRLPDLDTFWTPSLQPADQARTYPAITRSSGTTLLQSPEGRAIFSHQVEGLAGGAAGTETDEWDDGVLQETFAHLLFADNSERADGSSPLSLLRRDNDNVYVSRTRASESTAAFVDGFCDFLAGAATGQPHLRDSYVDGAGLPQVDDFDLSSHAMVADPDKGECTRGSVAVSLWGIWTRALGGSQAGLRTLWQAATSRTAYADGTGEYVGATLGCYPSYLLGLQSRVGGAWGTLLEELALEHVPAPTPDYFASHALWLTVGVPYSGSGSLQAYDPSEARYYDRDQSQAYRFTHGGGPRTLVMTPAQGQDAYLELLGPGGWVAGDTSSERTGQSRSLTFTELPAGVYAVRVRVGVTTATGTFGYTITLN